MAACSLWWRTRAAAAAARKLRKVARAAALAIYAPQRT
jgi:hypothetical protein